MPTVVVPTDGARATHISCASGAGRGVPYVPMDPFRPARAATGSVRSASYHRCVVTHRRSATSAVIGGALVLAVAGCTTEPAGGSSTELDRATAAVLADAADRLADALADDDPCRALLEADALRERAARALENGEAPASVAAETTRVVEATTADLSCDPVNAAGEEPDETEDEAAAAEDEDGDEAEVAAAESDAGAEAADPGADGGSDGSSSSTSSAPDGDGDGSDDADSGGGGKQDPPGKAKGHDGDGGPPEDRGNGRGNG